MPHLVLKSPFLLFIPFFWIRSGSIRLGTLARRTAAGLDITCGRQVADPAAGRHHDTCAARSIGACAEGISPCLAAACAYLPYMVPAEYVASTGRAEWRAGYRRPRKWYAAPHRRQNTPPSTHSLHTAGAAAQQGRGSSQAADIRSTSMGSNSLPVATLAAGRVSLSCKDRGAICSTQADVCE